MTARRRVCRCAALALAGSLAGCGDPTVNIAFEVPDQYRDQIATVELHVVEPLPDDEAFTCDDIAFQTVSADTIRLRTVKSFVQRGGESVPLSDIPREGLKLFFIEGLDEQALPVVAACAEVGVIDDDVSIELVGEPTTTVVLPTRDPGDAFERNEAIRVGIADFEATPLGDIEVRWTTTGPGGQTFEGQGRTGTEIALGRLEIPPEFPDRAGPAAVEVRARWMRINPGPLLSFNMPPQVLTSTLPGATTATNSVLPGSLYAVGRIGPNGEGGFVALGPSDNPLLSRELYIAYYDPSLDPPFRVLTPGSITGAMSIGLVERDGIDHPVVLTPTQWIEIAPTGALSPQPLSETLGVAMTVLPVGSCDGDTAGNERVLVQHGDLAAVTRVYDASGQRITDSPFENTMSNRPMAAGCVDSVESGVNRTVVYATGTLSQLFVSEMNGGAQGFVPALRNSIGYAPADDYAGPRLLATELSVEGTTVSRFRLAGIGNGADAERVDLDPTVSLPQSIAGGHIDGDDRVDVVAALPFGIDTEGRPQIRLLVSMGTLLTDGVQRLVGLSPGFDGERVAVWLYDFDANGIDDVLIGGATAFSILDMGDP